MTQQDNPRVAHYNGKAFSGDNGRMLEQRVSVRSIDVVVGGQFGSEAKGHVTAQIVRKLNTEPETRPVLNIRVAGPNAGHTVIAEALDPELEAAGPRAFPFRSLPVGIVEPGVYCAIAAGSEIELDVLLTEIRWVKEAGLWDENKFLLVDEEATMINKGHQEAEAEAGLTVSSGRSTGKGIGAARSGRLLRDPGTLRLKDDPEALNALRNEGVIIGSLAKLYITPWGIGSVGYKVVVEGTQGYGLGLHAGYYPKCTSSDTTAGAFLAMAGLSPWTVEPHRFQVTVVVRPFPIRIAGDSGPLYRETTWEALGLPQEITTVTHKVRRVGLWDSELARAAVQANGGGYRTGKIPHRDGRVRLALTMADQLDPNVEAIETVEGLETSDTVTKFIDAIEEQTGAMVELVTTGPDSAVWL